MRLAVLFALAAAAFGLVALLPDLGGVGLAGPSGDLGLGALLGKGSLLALGAAFAGGVLTSLTPCVYPLIPITVSIFGAKKAGSRAQKMGLSALYVLGIAVMYAALGIAAALSGKAFGVAMQTPLVKAFVGLVLVYLALSMFGLFEIRLPSAWQLRLNQVGGAGYAGAFAMGLVSGIIAAPCTGPVLAAALTFVAEKGSIPFGLAVMFAYALGMGLLFFLIGTFSLSLPRSGPWMETVKSIFGVALLSTGLVFLLGAFPTLKAAFFTDARGPLLAAAVFAAAGVLAGALTASFGGGTLAAAGKAVGLGLLVGGIVFGVGAGAARDRARAAAGFTWLHDYDAAVRLARAEGKPMIVDFWAEWCAACQELDRRVWSDPAVRAEASRFVAVKVDGTKGDDPFYAVASPYGIEGLPTVVLLDPRGREAPERVLGLVPPQEMIARLRGVDRACEGAKPPPKPAAGAPVAMACIERW
jgi:thiol:disulfide interchange protein DsbD